jgi:hypothetical protein
MTSMTMLEDIVAQIGVRMDEVAVAQKELTESQMEMAKEALASKREMEQAIERMAEGHERLEGTLDKWIGYFGNKIGYLVEAILIPGIKTKINAYGHSFNSLCPRRQFFRKDGRTFAEVDLFLEDGKEVMAVEVKTQLSVRDIDYHVNRLKLLRKHDSESVRGKTLRAAVAGLGIDADAREVASGLGMYVIEMVEDDRSVNVIRPAGGLGEW